MSLDITGMTNIPKEWHSRARMPHVGVPIRAPAPPAIRWQKHPKNFCCRKASASPYLGWIGSTEASQIGGKEKKKEIKPQKLFRSSGYLSDQIAGSAFGLVSIHSAVTEVKELSSELSGFPRIVCTADLYIYSFILIVFSCLRKNLRWEKQLSMYQRSYLLQLLF